eukprot:scaffold7344_cov145-Cylindrotheca_fusiformis.AAC.1
MKSTLEDSELNISLNGRGTPLPHALPTRLAKVEKRRSKQHNKASVVLLPNTPLQKTKHKQEHFSPSGR